LNNSCDSQQHNDQWADGKENDTWHCKKQPKIEIEKFGEKLT
jgi:hypothetical protein